jgi:hypothetical protein
MEFVDWVLVTAVLLNTAMILAIIVRSERWEKG